MALTRQQMMVPLVGERRGRRRGVVTASDAGARMGRRRVELLTDNGGQPVTIALSGGGKSDSVVVRPISVDVDVDSDNTNGTDDP